MDTQERRILSLEGQAFDILQKHTPEEFWHDYVLKAMEEYALLHSSQYREENERLRKLVADMTDLYKCGYAHNYGSPSIEKLEVMASAYAIKDGKNVTAEELKDWLH